MDASHIDWRNGSVARASLVTGVNENLIHVNAGGCGACASEVAVDGSHIYSADGTSALGRAEPRRHRRRHSFISGLDTPESVTVDGSHIYWDGGGATANDIGRVNIGGGNVDPSFVVTSGVAQGVAVDGSHIDWGNGETGAIGRANLDGTAVSNGFIADAGDDPFAPAVDRATSTGRTEPTTPSLAPISTAVASTRRSSRSRSPTASRASLSTRAAGPAEVAAAAHRRTRRSPGQGQRRRGQGQFRFKASAVHRIERALVKKGRQAEVQACISPKSYSA